MRETLKKVIVALRCGRKIDALKMWRDAHPEKHLKFCKDDIDLIEDVRKELE